MALTKSFEILVRRRIPFISTFLFWTILLSFGILWILDIFMMPIKNAPTEMATVYYILLVPNAVKNLTGIAAILFFIVSPIYFYARLYKPAKLTFELTTIEIKAKGFDISIVKRKIDKIFFNDLHNLLRQPKNKIQILIQQKNRKTTSFLLKNYYDGEELLNLLNTDLEKASISVYEDNMLTDHTNE